LLTIAGLSEDDLRGVVLSVSLAEFDHNSGILSARPGILG